MTAATVEAMPEATYHAHPALSNSGIKELLKTPAHYRQYIDGPRTERDYFDLGHAVHGNILGIGIGVDEIPADILASNGAASTTAAKAFIAESRAAGRIPLKADVVRQAKAMSDAVLTHPVAGRLLEADFAAEVSLFATDPETGIPLRARFDYLGLEAADAKTGEDASPAGFNRAVPKYGYDTQRCHYGRVLELVEDRRPPFSFIVVENTAPYLVGVYQLDEDWEAIGEAKIRRAYRLFAECMASGEWPGYPTEIGVLTPPAWFIRQFEEEKEQ